MTVDTTLFMPSFAEVVRMHGDRMAISQSLESADDQPVTLTYSELDQKAQSYGAALIAKGVKQGEAVGISIEKSADYVCALLGIWYAGAAFVPVDPGLPADRINYICDEAHISILLVNPKSSVMLSQLEPINYKLVTLSTLVEKPADPLPKFPEHNSDDLAYLIFTSGSTGRPKGVEVLHRGICNVLRQQIEAFELTCQSRSLWYLSTSFDASVSDLGTALLSGACLYIEAPCRLQPGSGLEEVFVSRQITYIDIPPSMLRLLNPATLAPSLESIVIGGEKCALDVVRQFASKVNLVNVYGPTEATICTSLGRCETTWQKSLIGQPLSGISYYLLDDQLNEVPKGTPGQLHIGGICLAKGYLHRPELNQSKFITHPRNGQRIYCTGDLVQLTEDGGYEFVGRIDRQFKLRGMLIEPEEIESRLLEVKSIRHTAVLKRPIKDGVNREILVAFIVPNERTPKLKPGELPNHRNDEVIQSLRTHLEDCLPVWMMPQRFELLEAMPLTKTGKIDLTALRQTVLSTKPVAANDAKKSSIASRLKEVFEQALGIDNVSADDDFFDIGGDSFAVIEATVIASAMGLALPPTLLMSHTSINALTDVLSHSNSSSENTTSGGMDTAQILDDINSDREFAKVLKSFGTKESPPVFFERCPEKILLTGASGFLGSRLLQELLENTSSTIFCIVRAENDDEALSRIKSTFKKYGLNQNQPWNRAIAIAGNLEVDNFGLQIDRYESLATEIDTIFHCAAQVNNLASYQSLRASNVAGTLRIVSFMSSGRTKCLHYASTLSVFVATENNQGILLESDDLSTTKTVYGGYAQTKFAAELLLRKLKEYLGPITFHRFGLITGDSQSGIGADNDFLNLFVKGINALHYAPEIEEKIAVDITPIDFAAKAMLQLSLQCMRSNEFDTFHIANGKSLQFSDLLISLQNYTEGSNEKLQILPVSDFKRQLLERISMLGTAESAACLALCRVTDADFSNYRTMDLFQATDVIFDMHNANKILEPLAITCPAPSSTLIDLYIRRILS